MIHFVQPLLLEHMVSATTQGDASQQAVFMGVSQSNRVVPTSREAPVDKLLVVDFLAKK